ncbi:MAG: GNAT family N-acetyltransferase [Flavobacteriaceae bacterium]
MDQKVIIRLATTADAAIISLLGRVTFTETFGHLFQEHNDLLEYYDRTFSVKKITRSLSKKNNVYWLALVNDLPVGYAKLKLDSPTPFLEGKDVCQLQKIYVLKDFLSLRIGLALQQTLIEKAAKSDCDYIWLSVLKDNERAVKFYFKNSFKVLGDHNFSIGREHFDFMAMAKEF